MSCKGRKSKNEPVEGEWIVHGFGGGFDSVEALLEGKHERRRAKITVGSCMVGQILSADARALLGDEQVVTLDSES